MIDRRSCPRAAILLAAPLALALLLPARASAASSPVAREPAGAPTAPPVPVTLYNVNTHELATFALPADGRAERATARALSRFLRCRRSGRRHAIARGVVALLADLGQVYRDRVIEVISGYRTPPFGTPRSKHFRGRAIDLRVRGVRTAEVRDRVWRTHHGVGVGYYPEQNFVHVDSRPGEHDTAWSSRYEGAPYRYGPAWSVRARQPLAPPVAGPPELAAVRGAPERAARW